MQLAKVINVNPLHIACFSDDFDSVLIYEYPNFLVDKYSLELNQYLVSANSYWPKDIFSVESDILLKETSNKAWRDIISFVPLFICKEKQERYSKKIYKRIFDEEEIKHFDECIEEYLNLKPNTYRYGFKTLIKY